MAMAWKQDAYWAPAWGPSGRKAKHRKGPAWRAQVSRPGPPVIGEVQPAPWPASTLPAAHLALLSPVISLTTALWQQSTVLPCQRPSTRPCAGPAPIGLGLCRGCPSA